MKAYEQVRQARAKERLGAGEYIDFLIDDFHELHGDRIGEDDAAILGGVGYLGDMPLTVIAQRRGKTLEENTQMRFGMPMPGGYRKAMRLMEQAEKFRRPVLTFIDTPGAFPGVAAEDRGQAMTIAQSIARMAGLRVPTIALVIGEGGSGGALALAVADRLWMLEDSVLSVISPEACASILYKDAKEAGRAAEDLALTAQTLFDFGLVDDVLINPSSQSVVCLIALKQRLIATYEELRRQKIGSLIHARYDKIRKVGSDIVR